MKKILTIIALITTINTAQANYIPFTYQPPLNTTKIRVIRTELKQVDNNHVSMRLKLVNTECIHDVGYVRKEKYSPKRLTSLVYTDNPNGEIAIFNIPNDAIMGVK